MRALFLASCLSLVVACSSSSSSGPATTTDSGSTANDSAATTDTGAATDTATDETTTDAPVGGDTWASFAQPFVTKYCVECHDAADKTGRDFTKESIVKANAPTIRCGVAPVKEPGCGASPTPKQFPIDDAAGTNPKPTDDERARMVAWIDAGMP